jgi:hypothetical protein
MHRGYPRCGVPSAAGAGTSAEHGHPIPRDGGSRGRCRSCASPDPERRPVSRCRTVSTTRARAPLARRSPTRGTRAHRMTAVLRRVSRRWRGAAVRRSPACCADGGPGERPGRDRPPFRVGRASDGGPPARAGCRLDGEPARGGCRAGIDTGPPRYPLAVRLRAGAVPQTAHRGASWWGGPCAGAAPGSCRARCCRCAPGAAPRRGSLGVPSGPPAGAATDSAGAAAPRARGGARRERGEARPRRQ